MKQLLVLVFLLVPAIVAAEEKPNSKFRNYKVISESKTGLQGPQKDVEISKETSTIDAGVPSRDAHRNIPNDATSQSMPQESSTIAERIERAQALRLNNEKVVLVKSPYTGAMIPEHGKPLLQVQRLVEMALQHSPEIRDVGAAWQAAQADLDEAKGARWPKVDFNGTSAANKMGKGGNPYGNGTLNRVGVTMSYTVFDGGRTSSQIESKRYAERSARAKYMVTRNKVAFDTTNAFLQIAKQQLLISAYQDHLVQMNLLSSNMVEIVKVVPGRRSELTQANTRVLQAEENLSNAIAKKRDYQIELIKLIGEKVLINQIKELEISIAPLQIDRALARAEEHPALAAADFDIQASKSQVKVSHASQSPQFDVIASKMNGVDQLGYADPGQIYLSVKWNAFQGFSSVANERAALARVVSSEEKYRQAVNEIEFKINSAWADYETQTSRIKNLIILKEGTGQVRLDYFDQWQSLGRRNLLEVLGAESEHLNTVVSLISSQIDQSVAAAKLHFEAGEIADWMVGDLTVE